MNKRNTGKGGSGKPAAGRGRPATGGAKRSLGSKRSESTSKRAGADERKPKRPAGSAFGERKTFGEKPKRFSTDKPTGDTRPKRAYTKREEDTGTAKPRFSMRKDSDSEGASKRLTLAGSKRGAGAKSTYTKRAPGAGRPGATERKSSAFGSKEKKGGFKSSFAKPDREGTNKRSYGAAKPFAKGKPGHRTKSPDTGDDTERAPKTANYGKPYKKERIQTPCYKQKRRAKNRS